MSEPMPNDPIPETTPEQDAALERAMAGMEAQADLWAVEVNLPSIIENMVSVSSLSPSAPPPVRAKFVKRQRELIDGFMRQSFMEGWLRGGLSRKDFDRSRRPDRDAVIEAARLAEDARADCDLAYIGTGSSQAAAYMQGRIKALAAAIRSLASTTKEGGGHG